MPPLPSHYLARDDCVEDLKGLLPAGVSDDQRSAFGNRIAIRGMAGTGKSVLAAALAYDADLREVFRDGVLWIAVGEDPDMTELQAQIFDLLGEPTMAFENEARGKSALSKLLRDKACLLILDNVWTVEHVAAFDALGAECAMIVTTQLRDVVVGTGAEPYELQMMGEDEAGELLRLASGTRTRETLPPVGREIVRQCGYLPLAIAMVGASLRGRRANRWRLVLERLQDADLHLLGQKLIGYEHATLFGAVDASFRALPGEVRERYLDLAVFPKGWSIPELVFETLWADRELSGRRPIEVVDLFLDHSLAHRGYRGRITLHDLQYDYVRNQAEDPAELHNQLLEAYGKRCTEGWASAPDDDYFFRHLIYHLIGAGRESEVKAAAKDLLSGVPDLHPAACRQCLRVLGTEAKRFAALLLRRPTTHRAILCLCLGLLGREAKEDAKRLLKEHKSSWVLCKCLDLLGKEAKDDAKRLLKEHKSSWVLCKCVDLLGKEAKDDAKRLLKEHRFSAVLCKCLDLLGKEAKDDAKRLLKEHRFPTVLCKSLRLLGDEAKDDAKRLLKEHRSSWVLCRCLDLLAGDAKDDAKRLLKEHRSPWVLCKCLHLLGEEAKDDAKRLLKEHKSSSVLSKSLHLLGDEAKDDAKRLLKTHTSPGVLSKCLDLLGDEAKDDAKRLLKTHTSPGVLSKCLDLLREEAKDDAKRLLKEATEHQVICACLNVLGEEAKDDAKRLLKEATEHQVICACLNVLGEEAKDHAKRLLKDAKDAQVICACLNVLGEEAKDDAKRLLKEATEHQVICACLNVLGAEAKDHAKRLFKDAKNPDIICACVNVLGEEGKDDAKRLLKEMSEPQVICACLSQLASEAAPYARQVLANWEEAADSVVVRCFGVAADTPEAQAAAVQILSAWDSGAPHLSPQLRAAALNVDSGSSLRSVMADRILPVWRAKPRQLVHAALNVYAQDPVRVAPVCTAILSRWKKEIDYQRKQRLPQFDRHLVFALMHRDLRSKALPVARDMLAAEAERPGYLSDDLRTAAEGLLTTAE